MRLLLLLFFLSPTYLISQPSLFDVLHTRSDTATLRIETDWNKLVRKKKNKVFQQATVMLTVGESTFKFKGKLRSRGNTRLEVCQNPSLKLKLKKAELIAAGFSDLNELKFVLQCSNNSMGQNYLNREQMIYDLHAVYSDFSHRTTPVRLDLGRDELISSFMIEHKEQMATRFNARVLETKRISTRGLQRDSYVNMCLFNFLILNTDWHVSNLHNLTFINPNGSLDLIPIPYDFDYSGFVGTHYAVPHDALEISSIYVPTWLGKRVTPEEIKTGAEHYLARREAAEQLLAEHPGLDNRDRKRMLKRLAVFYKLLEDEKRLVRLVD
jgi:hypothetical protein